MIGESGRLIDLNSHPKDKVPGYWANMDSVPPLYRPSLFIPEAVDPRNFRPRRNYDLLKDWGSSAPLPYSNSEVSGLGITPAKLAPMLEKIIHEHPDIVIG